MSVPGCLSQKKKTKKFIVFSTQSELAESVPLTDGVKVERADKKECKEDHSLKLIHPTNKAYVPLYLAAENEAEILEWFKDLTKAVDLGMVDDDSVWWWWW